MKYLVVDDETVNNSADLDDFKQALEGDVKDRKDLGIFVPDYTQAMDSIKRNNDIVICFIDLEIPRSIEEIQANKIGYWGLDLIEEIYDFNKNIDIIINSAHIKESNISEKIANIRKIPSVGECFCKPNLIPQRSRLYEEAKKKQLQNLSKNGFDYTSLNHDLSIYLSSKSIEVKEIIRDTLISSYKIGKALIDVKSRLERGQFQNWVTSEFGWELRSAQRFMSVARTFTYQDIEELASHSVSMGVLDNLATKNTPPGMRTYIVSRLKNGEKITCASIKQVKDEYKAQQQQTSNSVIDIKVTKLVSNQSEITSDLKNLQHSKSPEVKQEIFKVLNPKRSWVIGNRKHIIVSLDPNSDKFLSSLPQDIEFNLIFPPNENWQAPKIQSRNELSFISNFPERDDESFLKGIENLVKSSTLTNSNVVVQFIPHNNILLLLEKLECRAFIADKDREKCLELIDISKNPMINI